MARRPQIPRRSSKVSNFNGNAKHDYKIEIPISEVAEMVETIGSHGASKAPETVQKEFTIHLRSLLRIIDACKMDTSQAEKISMLELAKVLGPKDS